MAESTGNSDTRLNDQVTDSITAVQKILEEGGIDSIQSYSDQIVAHAVGLALLNAVNQQQQRYILQNAITTAAAKAILEADPKEALKFAREGFADNDIISNITSLKTLLEEITGSCDESTGVKSTPASGSKKASTTGTARKTAGNTASAKKGT